MSRATAIRRVDPAVLDSLRRRIRALEGGCGQAADGGILALGAPPLDEALPWGGLPRAALHEVLAADRGAAVGFCAGLLARLAGGRGAVLWCRRGYGRGLYGPGLTACGLDPARLVVVRGRTATDVLWVMEEALRSGALAAVLGEAEGIGVTAARRLQLAAEGGATTALLLRPRDDALASPAVTRWRVSAAPAGRTEDEPGVGRPRWRVDLLKCRGAGGATADGSLSWLVEWRHGTDGTTAGGFAVVADLRDRSCPTQDGEGGDGAALLRLAG